MANSAVLLTSETAESNISNAPQDAPSERMIAEPTEEGDFLLQHGTSSAVGTGVWNRPVGPWSRWMSILLLHLMHQVPRMGEWLLHGERGSYEVEETKIWGPNMLAFRLITGGADYYVVGCYIPPSDLATLEQVKAMWAHFPKDFSPLLVGI